MQIITVVQVLDFQLGAVSVLFSNFVDLHIGVVVAETDLIPYRKEYVALHQKYFVWMIEHRPLLYQCVGVEINRYTLGVYSSQLQPRHLGDWSVGESNVQYICDAFGRVHVVYLDLGWKAEVVGESHRDCFLLV